MACHLTFPKREVLYRLLKAGTSKTEIARLLGRDRSTIYRELQRNTAVAAIAPSKRNGWPRHAASAAASARSWTSQ